MAAAAVLEARALNVWRGDRQVLRDLSLAVRPGECLHVSGPNGAGKTTLLRVLTGLLPPETGEVRWRDAPIDRDPAPLRADLAYLGHPNAVKGDLTARENLFFLAGLRRRLAAAEIDAALERAGIAQCAHLPARAMSAGQRRRLALARLTLSPAVLWVVDEPATNLDAGGTEFVQTLLTEHLDRGGIAVAASHQRSLATHPGIRRLEIDG